MDYDVVQYKKETFKLTRETQKNDCNENKDEIPFEVKNFEIGSKSMYISEAYESTFTILYSYFNI